MWKVACSVPYRCGTAIGQLPRDRQPLRHATPCGDATCAAQAARSKPLGVTAPAGQLAMQGFVTQLSHGGGHKVRAGSASTSANSKAPR